MDMFVFQSGPFLFHSSFVRTCNNVWMKHYPYKETVYLCFFWTGSVTHDNAAWDRVEMDFFWNFLVWKSWLI